MGSEWAFEVGVVDRRGRRGVVRCSTFQVRPYLFSRLPLSWVLAAHSTLQFDSQILHNSSPATRLTLTPPGTPHAPPAGVPSTVIAATDRMGKHDDALARARVSDAGDKEVSGSANTAAMVFPGGMYSHASYVKVDATCRLRRIWFCETRIGRGCLGSSNCVRSASFANVLESSDIPSRGNYKHGNDNDYGFNLKMKMENRHHRGLSRASIVRNSPCAIGQISLLPPTYHLVPALKLPNLAPHLVFPRRPPKINKALCWPNFNNAKMRHIAT
jgi:hypothetical protein